MDAYLLAAGGDLGLAGGFGWVVEDGTGQAWRPVLPDIKWWYELLPGGIIARAECGSHTLTAQHVCPPLRRWRLGAVWGDCVHENSPPSDAVPPERAASRFKWLPWHANHHAGVAQRRTLDRVLVGEYRTQQ